METLVENKKVRLNYEILQTFDAGIELFGHEVKSLRNKHGSLEGAHVVARGGEAYLLNATIPPYQPKNTPKDYEPNRNRRLLLTKKEIKELVGIEHQRGLTIVPISVYNGGKSLKLHFAAVRGKKKIDKREDLKKRDSEREMRRTLKRE